MRILTDLFHFLFAPRYHWKFRRGDMVVRMCIRGFFTRADVHKYHLRFLDAYGSTHEMVQMKRYTMPILYVIVSIVIGYARIAGFRSAAYQAIAHMWVAGLFVSGTKNIAFEAYEWFHGRGHFPSWVWYQFILAIGLTILEAMMALKTFGII